MADDEAPARDRLLALLEDISDVEVVATCATGAQALAAITEFEPVVLFLDIRMPGLDGFDVLRRIDAQVMPLIVFVTAFDEFAIAAFEANAVDYLLKPFSRARFSETLGRLRARLGAAGSAVARVRRIESLLEALLETTAAPRGDVRVPVRESHRTTFVRAGDIVWLESRGNYVRLHTTERTPLIRSTLTDLVERLGPDFIRIHRSWAVHRGEVDEVRTRSAGGFEVRMSDGALLRSSARYDAEVRSLLYL